MPKNVTMRSLYLVTRARILIIRSADNFQVFTKQCKRVYIVHVHSYAKYVCAVYTFCDGFFFWIVHLIDKFGLNDKYSLCICVCVDTVDCL